MSDDELYLLIAQIVALFVVPGVATIFLWYSHRQVFKKRPPGRR